MPRNITIKEVGVAQNISGVTHIKVPDIESSSLDYVPEEDLIRRFKVINANGTYTPSDDLGAGYVALLVDVPVKSVKGKDKNTGKITDVSVNPETGEIEKTEQSSYPAGIHIVIPPKKKNYNDGDVIDFSGIHVYLMDENNHQWISDDYPTGEIPFNELTFPETIAHSEGQGYNTSTLGGESAYYTNLATWRYKWSDGEPHSLIASSSGYLVGLQQLLYCFSSQQGVAGASTVSFDGGEPGTFGTETSGTYTINGETKTYYRASCGSTYYLPETTSGLEYWEVSMPVTALSDVDMDKYAKIVLEGTHSGGGGTSSTYVPVQWSKDGGAVLEDTFEINVS